METAGRKRSVRVFSGEERRTDGLKVFIPDQLRAVLVFFLSGVAFGVIRDVFRLFGMIAGIVPVPERKRGVREMPEKEPAPSVRFFRGSAVFSADVVFCISVTAVFAVLTYAFCRGRFRSFSFFSAAAGFYLYSVFPGKVLRVPFEWGAYLIRRVFRAAARIVLAPFRHLFSALKKKVVSPCVSLIRKAVEARRLKKTEKRNVRKTSTDKSRKVICSAGRR